MSMLAERKIKQKWSLNPRGKVWSEDSNKFGQKLLEKMGWSKGKGLGAREDGIVEHLKVSYKNDSKGMGFKDRNDQWTEHDANFNALLETLSGKKIEENDIKLSSLEEKSQSSKVRVHYKKFTRGKDLSKWSEKDIANIFGKKTLKEEIGQVEEKSEETVESESSFVRNSGSMVDYFKKKLPNFGKGNGYVVGSNGVLKKNEDSEEEAYVGFGFKSEVREKSDSEDGFGKKRKLNGGVLDGTPKKVKKEEHFSEEEIVENEKPKKKKKKKMEEDSPIGLSNPAFDPFLNNVEVCKHVLNTIDEEEESLPKATPTEVDEATKEIKKKKKKEKLIDNSSFDTNADVSSNDTFEVKRKHKKKINGLDNPYFDDNTEESGCQNNKLEIKKKKKEKNGLDNPNFDDNVEENCCQNNKFEIKKRKKEKNGLDNPNFDDNVEESGCQNNRFEVKKKKKENFDTSTEDYEVRRKKKRKSGDESLAVDNPVFDSSNPQNSYADSNYEVKRKKKKKNEDLALDNPVFDSQTSNDVPNEPSFDLILNVTSTPSTPKPESAKKSSVKRRKSVRFSDVNEERIIPNKEDIENRDELFDINSRIIENGLKDSTNLNIDEISKKIDGFQSEIENEINEAKVTKFIGEVGSPDGDNEKLPDGTKIKFKYASFGRSPSYMNKSTSRAKTSYKHLIKGDIILGFKNTNLHEIEGYGVINKRIKK